MAAGNREPVEFRDRLAAAGDHRHSLPVLDVTADGRLDAGRRIGHLTHHDRPVATAHHPLLQLAGERAMRLVIARDNDQAGGVAVEPVDDTRPLRPADRRPSRTAGEQSVNQRAGGMAGSGMHDEARRLIDDDQVVILVKHTEVHRFGLEPARLCRRHHPAEPITLAQPDARSGRSIVDPNMAVRDQPLDAVSAVSNQQAGQVLVESRGIDRDGVVLSLGQARRGRPPRHKVPSRSTATPTVIAESATLKIGQCGTWMKSITEPLTPRS